MGLSERPPAPPAAHAKYWLWKVVTVVILAPIYVSVIAEGLRIHVSVLGQKLYKLPIPGIAALGDYEETRRLDLAMFLGLVLLAAVWWLWEKILFVFLSSDEALHDSGWNVEAYQRVVLILGIVILGADSMLFYSAVVQVGWGGARFSLPALMATAAYLAVIVFISLVSLNLRKPLLGR